MINENKVLRLGREHLSRPKQNTPIEQITLYDFTVSPDVIKKASTVIFEDNKTFKILKSRRNVADVLDMVEAIARLHSFQADLTPDEQLDAILALGNIVGDGKSVYCIEIDRSGLPEEDMVVHHEFADTPSRDEVLEYIHTLECGYNDKYCNFKYHKV